MGLGMAMRLETKRLILVPLTVEQLERAIDHYDEVVRSMGYSCGAEQPAEAEKRSDQYALRLYFIRRDDWQWIFYTSWFVVLKRSGQLVGEVGAKGYYPGGETEIGYRTRPEYRGMGIMTEAVEALCGYLFEEAEPEIRRIYASTERSNSASHRVLEKNGFAPSGDRFGYLRWEKAKANGR